MSHKHDSVRSIRTPATKIKCVHGILIVALAFQAKEASLILAGRSKIMLP